MSDVFPACMFSLLEIAAVPLAEFNDAPACEDPHNEQSRLAFLKKLRNGPDKPSVTTTGKRTLTFNAALWLKPRNLTEHFALLLHYADDRGEFAVIVDQTSKVAESGSMLSGQVSLPVKGAIKFMKVACTGAKHLSEFSVDELFVQRVEDAQAANRKTA